MTTSQTSFLSEIVSQEPIPLGKRAYFRERLKNRLYDLVVSEFLRREKGKQLSRAALARRIGRKPEQVTRWLGSPGNWTLDTVSDLLLGMGAELMPSISMLDRQPPRNFVGPEWLNAETDGAQVTASWQPTALTSSESSAPRTQWIVNG